MKQAVIVAGGKGSRLLPYTALLPKPLMPLGDRPVLELLLEGLRAAGITDVILAVNHLGHLLEAFFGDGARLGLSITYSVEDDELGTAGPLGLLLHRLEPNFVFANGDLLTTLDTAKMVIAHEALGADATIGSYRRVVRSEFGVLKVDSEMRLTAYHEKPEYEQLISMGLYVLRRDAIRPYLVPGSALDMPTLMENMRRDDLRIYCHGQDCIWLDIGCPQDFAEAQSLVLQNRDAFSPVRK
ncbi:MAG: nucleoside-diphosphate-sugar pyrophosphorylase [Alphaproteobacteria bacterium]|nr:nucleoside-diphosphate-sugar pyrophosphorylase [Alphaproteobacteria bacterium]